MIIPFHTVIALSAVNRPQRSVQMALHTVLRAGSQAVTVTKNIGVLGLHRVVQRRQIVQLCLPLIVIDILREDAWVSEAAEEHGGDGGEVEEEEKRGEGGGEERVAEEVVDEREERSLDEEEGEQERSQR